MKYDRFNLEEEIQSVWGAVEDLDTILYRIMDASEGPPSEDDITTMLMGLKEIHNGRCMKLWDVFENMVHEKCFKTEDVDAMQGKFWPTEETDVEKEE